MVAKAAAQHTAEGRAAMAAICEQYWMPLYAYARRSGCSPHDAEDVTQSFIYGLLRRNSLASADAGKGRLRSFLMTALNRHIISTRRKDSTRRRGGGAIVHGLSVEYAEQSLAEDSVAYARTADSPQDIFERRWALALLEKVLNRLRCEYEARAEAAVFAELQPHLGGREDYADGAYALAATRLGISIALVRVRMHRLRRRYGELLREEIAATVPAAELDDEIRFLASVFNR